MRGRCWRRFIDVHDRRRTRDPPAPARADLGRSPFVRLRELLGTAEPGQPAISLAVGEPQHPVPPLRRRRPRRPYRRVRPLSHEQGPDDFLCRGRRLARAPLRAATADRPRERDPRAQRLARGTVSRRHRRRTLRRRPPRPTRHVDPQLGFYAAYAAGAVAANCEPVPAGDRRDRLSLDLDALPEELLARTAAFFIASPANPQGAVAELAYLARLVRSRPAPRIPIFSDECYSEIYTRDALPACWKRPAPILRTWSSSSRCPSARTCRADGASASPPATGNFSHASSCVTSRHRRCPCRRSGWPSPPMATRRMSRTTAGPTREN